MATPSKRRNVTFVGIAGSLRRGSYNRGLIRAAVELAPPGIKVIAFDPLDLPLQRGPRGRR